MWRILSQPSFYTITFVFMMNQRFSNEKQTNMWYRIASSALNQRTKFVGFTDILQTDDITHLQDGIANSEKAILSSTPVELHNSRIN